MKKLNNRGFGLVGVLAVIVIIAAAGGIGAYVYHKHHKANGTTNSSTSSNNSSAGKSGGTAQTPNPYAGWTTYTLASTGLSFKYPANWTLKDQSLSSNNIYSVLLSGPNQLAMTISVRPSGGYGGDDAAIVSSESISSLGGSYFLNYEGLPSDNGMVDRAYLATSSSTKYLFPKLASNSNTDVFAQADFANNGMMIAKTLNSFKSDQSFQQAKLIIQSMAD